jgi:hypothetical protein
LRSWKSRAVRYVLPATALSSRHPMFRGGCAFSLGELGSRPRRLVLWRQLSQSRPVVVGWAALAWDEPAAGQVTVERIHWPSNGCEDEARAALVSATSLIPVGPRAWPRPDPPPG